MYLCVWVCVCEGNLGPTDSDSMTSDIRNSKLTEFGVFNNTHYTRISGDDNKRESVFTLASNADADDDGDATAPPCMSQTTSHTTTLSCRVTMSWYMCECLPGHRSACSFIHSLLGRVSGPPHLRASRCSTVGGPFARLRILSASAIIVLWPLSVHCRETGGTKSTSSYVGLEHVQHIFYMYMRWIPM